MIVAQVRAVARDIGVDAVKIGMLGTVATIAAVERALDELDPAHADRARPGDGRRVGRAAARRGGARRARRAAAAARDRGHAEPARGARARRAMRRDADAPSELARAVHALGPRCVVVTGGHREQAIDVFFDGERARRAARASATRDGAAHGSGCTHSSVLAAQLALGCTPLEAARAAKASRRAAVRDGLREIGAGAGPVDVLGIRAPRADASRPDRGRPTRGGPGASGIIRSMKFLRMKPGMARSDRRGRRGRARGRGAADRGVPPPARRRACGPPCPSPAATGAARRSWSQHFADVPRDAERVIFFPRAAGGS